MDSSEPRDDRGRWASERLALLAGEIERVFVGKRQVVEHALTCLLAKGHLLIEDIPGVGKTTLAKALARAVNCSFRRIQFTSDMLPSDIIGTSIFNQAQAEFRFERGPIFANLVLADEINRASPRTQSALLEAMNEAQVTVDNMTHSIDRPFFVVATQNPMELHGTYPLPESQLDRFMMCLSIGYPGEEHEKAIIQGLGDGAGLALMELVMDGAEVMEAQAAALALVVRPEIVDYVYRIIGATRSSSRFESGASPRAGVHLLRAARARALLHGRPYVLPDDVKAVVLPVLSHRLVARGEARLGKPRLQAEVILAEMLEGVEAP